MKKMALCPVGERTLGQQTALKELARLASKDPNHVCEGTYMEKLKDDIWTEMVGTAVGSAADKKVVIELYQMAREAASLNPTTKQNTNGSAVPHIYRLAMGAPLTARIEGSLKSPQDLLNSPNCEQGKTEKTQDLQYQLPETISRLLSTKELSFFNHN